MLLSYCYPCRDRLHSVKQTLPTVIAAARKSPPVEIIVLDYGSTDDLAGYLRSLSAPEVKYVYYDSPYFHMAHSRNLSILAAKGEYVVSSDAETLVDEKFFDELRKAIKETVKPLIRMGRRPSSSRLAKEQPGGGPCDGGCRWWTHGVFCIKRSEFIDAGGFDEQFEFYGPEDKDIIHRFKRRGLDYATINNYRIIRNILTPDSEKGKNYRLPLSKGQMRRLMGKVYERNEMLKKTTANEDGWGKW